MKKRLVTIATVVIMMFLLAVPTFAKTETKTARVYNFYTEKHVNNHGKVDKVYKGVRFITKDGNVWAWRIGKGQHFRKGQKVKLVMDTTAENLYQWKIVKVKAQK